MLALGMEYVVSSWKNLSLLGHPYLIESKSLDSIVKVLHHRPPDESIDNYF